MKNKCWRLFGDHDSNMLVDEQGNRLEEVVSYSCEFEGQFYDDGSSWVPDVDSVCNTCSCKVGPSTNTNPRNLINGGWGGIKNTPGRQ